MSSSEKSDHAHVRFRDGVDLVEFEGDKILPGSKLEVPIASQTKIKERKAEKKRKEGESVELVQTKVKKPSKRTASKPIETSDSSIEAKLPLAGSPPDPNTVDLSHDVHTIESTHVPVQNDAGKKSEDVQLRFFSVFQVNKRVLFLPYLFH